MARNFFHRSLFLLLLSSLLEWILIILLLANALLSFIIVWFAAYFELPPPCIFCSRFDHLFSSGESAVASAFRRGLFCETHVGELSELVFRFPDLASEIQEYKQKDGVLGVTVDKLKAAIMAARRSLGALYRELEDERSASAIAANQTMAMITRLQEEKAAMQTESIQYQRMLELVNELLIRRDKEKRELEEEMSLLRKKLNFCCKAISSSPSSSFSGFVEKKLHEEEEGEILLPQIRGSGYECGTCSRRMMGSQGKSLLPFLDAVSMENEANFSHGLDSKLVLSEEVKDV